jgi:hypothetical protein
MDLSFGARLRLQRERQQVALTAIAEQTKIKVSLLDGLERDDLSHWPGGIFRRSYVRSYAHAIGLEPETVVGEFLARYPDPVEEPTAIASARGGDLESSNRRPTTRLGYLISSAMSALPTLRVPPGGERGSAATEAPAADERFGGRDNGVADPPAMLAEVSYVDPAFDGLFAAETTPIVAEAEANDDPAAQDGGIEDAAQVSPEPPRVDLSAVAFLCTRLGCAVHVREVTPVLAAAATLLDAVGVILWTWESRAGVLRPAISHGYPDELLAQLPRVRPDADNAIARAFRSTRMRVIEGSERSTGALAAPLMTPAGCAGVLALEFRNGGERHECARALATILSAQLSTLVEAPELAQAVTA